MAALFHDSSCVGAPGDSFRPDRIGDLVPGWIVTVRPHKQWSYACHPYLSGEIESFHLDVPTLGLVPLGLTDMGLWDPREEYWGEPGEPIEVGELSLDESFDGLLPWGHIDNRPFLRCLHGYGLCLWRLERRGEAARVFDRLLWLSPSDNLGVRFLVEPVRSGEKWRDDL